MTTKRPWTVREHRAFKHAVQTEDGKLIATAMRREDAHLIAAAPAMYEVLKAYEQWEADLITDDEAWAGGMAPFPTITGPLYDRMMELQAMRNAALRAANPDAFDGEGE